MLSKDARGSGVQSLERALNIMEIIKEEGCIEVNELAGRMKMHRSSIYRIIAVLQKKGYVRHNSDNGKYSLGLKFLEMAEGILFHQELISLALPVMEKLTQRTRETCHLMVLDQGEVFYLAKVESPETIRMHSKVGIRMPAYCTAGGKVLLANLPRNKQQSILKGIQLKSFTPNTVTDPNKLMEILQSVLANGWAVDNEENEKGIMCLAAPIKRSDEEVVAAVTLSCPTFRTSSEDLDSYIEAVKEAAAEISLALTD